ncbi:NADH dehydrogenase [ubiquinone] 1 beta subcomplex subunit 4 [Erpetoichthys calabaricus]|uniref:NADH dehydrogenase [ubiquinone] 1 beta subcomplex subunit 4 n=1 Tax=Erpetoichthys calabaricus TaxID=27687 RepID=A0A8C4S2N8_ERPCA|nr:NADH dehydrogenase [ubiquinone] 1 beta subcomplex subunit 4 [Erpetoichthys calabaricus]
MADYKEAPLATRPTSLERGEYFDLSLEKRKAEEERLALRARLKREYQIQLNNPHRKTVVEDPALTRWTYARTNVYPNFRPTPKTSFLGAMCTITPLLFWYYVFKTDRDRKEQLIQEGKYERKFQLSS